MKGNGPGLWVGAALWAVQPIYILVELLVAARSTAPYSLADNTISDLGAVTCTTIPYPYGPVEVCSPWHLAMNGAFVVFGVLIAVGAVLLRRQLPAGRVATASVWLWVISGLGSVGAGVVPLDVDLELHALVALPTFVAQPVALVLLAWAIRRQHPRIAAVVGIAGVVCLVGTAAFLVRTGTEQWSGALERLALWPGYLAVPLVAWVLLRDGRRAVAA